SSTKRHWMPDRVVPEDSPYTYTWAAKQAIKFLKGLDENGTPYPLQLRLKKKAASHVEVTITNRGEVACNPNIQAFHEAKASVSLTWLGPDQRDITSEVMGPQGWSIRYLPRRGEVVREPKLLDPGQSLTLQCKAKAKPGAKGTTVTVEAFWNPQDPAGIVRDRITFTLTP
ncbi:MAG: hypothetical protein D6820_01650, partial [Lentisphaerae bacterium]